MASSEVSRVSKCLPILLHSKNYDHATAELPQSHTFKKNSNINSGKLKFCLLSLLGLSPPLNLQVIICAYNFERDLYASIWGCTPVNSYFLIISEESLALLVSPQTKQRIRPENEAYSMIQLSNSEVLTLHNHHQLFLGIWDKLRYNYC